MTITPAATSPAKLTTIATFPKHYFLENLAARADGSLLVTALTQKELWYVPRPTTDTPVDPVLVHTFDHITMGIAEAEPDIFYISISDGYTTHESYLMRLDLNGWTPGTPVTPHTVLRFDDRVRALNGSTLIAPNILLLADSFAGLIWRVDLPGDGGNAKAHVWLEHPSMAHDPNSTTKPPQPGVNGIRYAARSNTVYYTSTAQKLFMRVSVNTTTHDPASEPELVASGTMSDDFCIDEDAGVAYVTTHRENTIDRVPLTPARPAATRQIVAGDPFDQELIGPSSGVWGRDPGDYGRLAYFTTDGGTTAPPTDGIVRNAKVLRVEFAPTPEGRSTVGLPGRGAAR
jgi:hypothetical protein